jgi:hypothetical protein
MLVKSKSGKIYNPKRGITFNNRMIKLLSIELENSYEVDYVEFLNREINRHKNFIQLSQHQINFNNK